MDALVEVLKTCRTCGEAKPAEAFSALPGKNAHLVSKKCRPCVNAYQREWRKNNPEKSRASDKRFRAKPNPERKEKARRYMETYNAQNRDRINAWVRDWNKRNHEKKISYNRARRVRMAGNGIFFISPKDQRRLDSATQCAHCRGPFSEGNPANIDHIIPVIRGGVHGIGNLWVLCQSCNFRKHDTLYSVWRLRRVRAKAVQDDTSI